MEFDNALCAFGLGGKYRRWVESAGRVALNGAELEDVLATNKWIYFGFVFAGVWLGMLLVRVILQQRLQLF